MQRRESQLSLSLRYDDVGGYSAARSTASRRAAARTHTKARARGSPAHGARSTPTCYNTHRAAAAELCVAGSAALIICVYVGSECRAAGGLTSFEEEEEEEEDRVYLEA